MTKRKKAAVKKKRAAARGVRAPARSTAKKASSSGATVSKKLNWLVALDRETRRLKPATSWGAYGPYVFMFARYPRLQPTAWLDPAAPVPTIRADAVAKASPTSRPVPQADVEVPGWEEVTLTVQATQLAPSSSESRADNIRSLPTGGLTPGAERSPAALQDCARDITRGRKILDALLTEWEGRIEANSRTRRALAGLKPELRRQLAALVFDTYTDLEIFADRKMFLARAKRLGQEADRRRRMLHRKVARAKEAVTDLRDYAASLDPQIGEPFRRVAAACLERSAPLYSNPSPQPGGPPSAAYWRNLHRDLSDDRRNPLTIGNPIQDNMVRLYWFFVDGCALKGDDAEVRTGLLRNRFWRGHAPSVKVIKKHAYPISAGCGAVHSAVLRDSRLTRRVQQSKKHR